MKMRGKWAIGIGTMLIAVTSMASSASAQEIDINPPEQAYVGPLLGYDTLVISNTGYSASKGGLTYGGMAGIDTPVGKRGRVGLEAQVAGSTAAWTMASSSTVGTVTTLTEDKLAAGVDLYIGGKAGWMVAPKTQIFATLGYAYSRFTASTRENGIKTAQAGVNLSGFRVGAGAEYALSPHIRARLEYRYTHYGEIAVDTVGTGYKAERHQVVGGLLYGF
ncbi:outer membrane beta-barrel protein [Novosphingobium rosa]|uniref:outer membrane beta-barrel protein n=1 Tax=Novosphingobium rosa TaxID=76978 RepID=UPI000835B3D4|nr:outer membrane beta-barrel protein [Novosphingobium rosa]